MEVEIGSRINQNEEITISTDFYVDELIKAYNRGRIEALLIIGKSISEVAWLLDIDQSIVKDIYENLNDFA